MSRLALMLVRLAASAWIGAAVLFVINGVSQVTSGKFESITTDQLVLLRFPAYYLMGFLLTGIAFVGAILSGDQLSFRRRAALLGLFGTAIIVMIFDYLVVYSPLAAMIDPPGKPRPAEFQTLHRWSMKVNTLQIGLVLLGALIANWPARRPADTEPRDQ